MVQCGNIIWILIKEIRFFHLILENLTIFQPHLSIIVLLVLDMMAILDFGIMETKDSFIIGNLPPMLNQLVSNGYLFPRETMVECLLLVFQTVLLDL